MAGHSFFLRLCSSTTRLQTVIKGTQRVLSDKSLTLYVVEYSQQAGLSRSEAEVAGTIQRRHRFELKTLNEENFLRIAGSEKAHVVFGHLYSAKYLINPVDIPTSKGKKSTANIRAWVTHAMEDLLKLVGRKKVKQAALNLFKNVMALQQLSTTVPRLFASKLKDSQIRRASTFVECTAQQLKGADDFRTKLKQAMDGDGIQKKLYAYNDGRPSRFNEVVFEDFDSQELEAARRKGFGNARAVRKLFEVKKLVRISDENYARELKRQETLKHAMGKAMSRLMVNGMTVLALEDVGVDVSGEKSKEQKDLIKLLDKLYLVDEIKEQLTQLRNQMIVADCEGSGLPEVGHFVFHGSPGTVKTVARVITEILHGMDHMLDCNAGLKSRFTRFIDFPDWEAQDAVVFLSEQAESDTLRSKLKKLSNFGNGRDAVRVWKELLRLTKQVKQLQFHVESGKDDGEYVGQTKAKVTEKLVEAKGGLLFIDEAYELGKGMYGEEARTNPSYAGMVIVIAGYAKDMDVMLNPEDGVAFLQVKAEQEKMKLDGRSSLNRKKHAWLRQQKTRVKKKHEANDEAERDAGVSDENWEELERAKEAPAAHLEALKRARDQATREEERRRELEEERRRAAAIQEKIRQICPCPAGFKWYKSGSGWRCGGGSHFVWMHS
ncbi:hypothetical protein JG687_00013543 [Phytophthora cactorum]|uniref:P-loop containing nucleoside triphosphate hydrolase n=1 Tax=Phytophthora cactorum TaxID=29920 RepID=A0A8T1U115_9STRA|nr:hypothetical protein JG687_00013543 [Phytophthora cactorum]